MKRVRWLHRLTAGVLAALLCSNCGSLVNQVTLQSRPGVTENVEYIAGSSPRANAILFIGAPGTITGGQDNFLMRVRYALARGGLNIAVVDAPSDHPGGMNESFRYSAQHSDDIAAVVNFLKSKADLPVWLIGTSSGTISAANGAERLGPPRIAGIVLTSAVWTGALVNVSLNEVAVPILVVHNRNDGCNVSPYYGGADHAVYTFLKAPRKELLTFTSTKSSSGPCDALSPHGFYGIESEVVQAMLQWMLAQK